jgi:tetratricopeptide (TPR) repeat protein
MFITQDPDRYAPLVTFNFVDPGTSLRSSFATHLEWYSGLFARLKRFNFVYVGTDQSHFPTAEAEFTKRVRTTPPNAIQRLIRYFQLRELEDTKQYSKISLTDLDLIGQAKKIFAGDPFDSIYHRWRKNEIWDLEISQELNDHYGGKARELRHVLPQIATEEITSLKVEYEEEIPDAFPPAGAGQRGLPALPAPRRFLRWGSAMALTVFLFAALVVIGLRQGVFFSRQPQAEAILPQVPGKKSVAVVYFENASRNPDLDWLRGGLADMLITDLSRSGTLTVLSREQLLLLLERGGRKPTDPIALDTALDIAHKTHAATLVTGNFVRLGEKIRVDLRLLEAGTGRILAAESLQVDRPDQILAQIDLLSLKLAADLGARPGKEEKIGNLADLMTDNLAAYRFYSLGVEKAQALHNQEAIALFERAIALDPQFAMAHARLGYAYAVTWGLAEKGRPYLERAFRLSSRLTPKDRLYIAAWYAIANLDYLAAVRPLRQIIAEYPLEIEAYGRLASVLSGEEQTEEAIGVVKQGLAIDPEAQDLYNLLGGIYAALGRHDEAIEALQRYVALAPPEPNAHDSLGLSYRWAGLYDKALEQYNQALARNP